MANNKKIRRNIMNIGIDKYNIQDEWLHKIASKYLDIDTINKNKTGLFGYINEVMATEVRQSIAHRNFLIDETFLNTASLRRSIYNKAKSYNYNIPLAKPASLYITFSVLADDVLKYGEREVDENGELTENIIFKLDKENQFFLANFPFMLEYDVIIRANKLKNNDYSYTARYDFESSAQDFSLERNKRKNPYIKTWVDRSNEYGSIISIYLKIFQIERTVHIEENYSSDISDNLLFTVPYEDQLAKFNVKYSHVKEPEYIKGYFNDTFTPEDEKFFFYSFNEEELNITFSSLPNSFKPALNSKLEIEMYTTKGFKGNFNFDGDIVMMFSDSRLQGAVQYQIFKETNPLGGVDAPSMKEIKQELIREFLTRENLVTEYDLNTFFKQIIKEEIVNESDILFMKKRDDVIKRMYGVYLLMKDKHGLVIPTNTINFHYPCDYNQKHIFIPAGTKIIYNSQKYIKYYEEIMGDLDLDIYYFNGEEYVEFTEETYKLLPEYEKVYDYGEYTIYDEETMDLNTYDVVYRLPFSLVYKKYPFQRLLMIKDTINDEILYNYSYVNSDINAEFLTSNLEIDRKSINFNDEVNPNEIRLSLSLDTTYPTDLIYNSETLKNKDNLRIRGVIKGKSGLALGYFDFDLHDTQKLIYRANLITENEYDENNKLLLTNCIRHIETGDVIKNFPIKESMDIDLYFLVRNDMSNFSKFPSIKKMVDTKGYTVAVVMSNYKPVKLFKILNPISVPVLEYKSIDKEDPYTGIQCMNIPVIGANYLNNYRIYNEFFDIFDIYFDVLIDNFNKLENSTKLDLKFYNTFGKSYHFTSDTTNLKLELNIKLLENYSNELDYKIKNFIIDFVQSINYNKQKVFAISNLIRLLEKEFPDIAYIEFVSLNGKKDQAILYDYPDIKDLNRKQLINYIPEYINIGINEKSYTGDLLDFDVDIKINYK